MSNVTITPNMNLPVAIPGQEPGPDWATDIVADMYAIDSHDHTNGKGVPITPDGMNITADLPMNGNNLTEVRSVNFEAQAAPLNLAGDLGCLYVSGADLYYNDEAGNQVRITQSGSVTGSSGTITGLPSGTASASYSAGTFTFQSATSTPANMAVGPLIIGRNAASSKTVSLTPNAAQAANYDLTFPAALPGSTLPVTTDASGNIAFGPATGSGSVVLATTPTITTPVFSGVPTGTITAAAFTPTVTYTRVSGGTITFTVDEIIYYYHRIGNVVFVQGEISSTSLFTSGGSAVYTVTTTIPIATTTIYVAGSAVHNLQTVSLADSTEILIPSSNTGVITQNGFLYNVDSAGQRCVFTYTYIIN